MVSGLGSWLVFALLGLGLVRTQDQAFLEELVCGSLGSKKILRKPFVFLGSNLNFHRFIEHNPKYDAG